MSRTQIHNKPELKPFRKKLRNNSTSAEAVLWIQLRHRQLAGRKFRRQHSIGKYILDFYCPDEQLVIELDGEHHYWEEGMQKDNIRTAYLNSKNIRVIRFENKWIFEDMECVLTQIKSNFKNNM